MLVSVGEALINPNRIILIEDGTIFLSDEKEVEIPPNVKMSDLRAWIIKAVREWNVKPEDAHDNPTMEKTMYDHAGYKR